MDRFRGIIVHAGDNENGVEQFAGKPAMKLFDLVVIGNVDSLDPDPAGRARRDGFEPG